jgi:drug/metabolite transporter (DMT)-like permease
MPKNKILLYFLFALLASFVNLIGQHIFLTYNKNLFLAVIVGSIAPLVFKYVLVSSFVFDGKKRINIKTFLIYAFFGACITPIIWIMEVIFLNIFGTVFMRDIGALLGIALAYFIKYEMDKRYVFEAI